MSELLKVVLTDETARSSTAQKTVAAKASEAFQPWQGEAAE